MPKKSANENVQCIHFKWKLRQRDGVYFADGRSNNPSVGRHSLGTRDRADAVKALGELDLAMAIEAGLAPRPLPTVESRNILALEHGRKLYEDHVRRPPVVGGAHPVTSKRYRAVFDKFLSFATDLGIGSWNGVNVQLLTKYAAHLDDEGYAPRTEYLELTTIRQAMKWFVDNGHLPAACLFRMPMRKPQGTDTYCWRPVEVNAIVAFCSESRELRWLGEVFTALVSTGLRISELASLKWADIDRSKNIISLKDESSGRLRGLKSTRRTKSGRDRTLPINDALKPILDRLPKHPDGRVFHGPLGGVLKPDTVRNILIRDVLAKLASQFPSPEGEIGFSDGRLHSCRHYFCSQCASGGVREQEVMAWLGHADSKMVRHYFHLSDETAQRQMSRLRLLGEACGLDAVGSNSVVVPEDEEKSDR